MSTVGHALVAREANANISDYQDYVLPSHKMQVDSLTKLCASGVGKHCNRCKLWLEIQRSTMI